MGNKIVQFSNAEFGNVRAMLIDGEPWFVGKDVATALGYEKARNALATHVPDKYKKVSVLDAIGGKQKVIVINEAGMYKLVMRSKLESAEEFSDWVCEDVLTSIRETINEKRFQLIVDKLVESVKAAEPQIKCVYVLKMSNNAVKIGVTGNFRQRARVIEPGRGLIVIDWYHTAYLPSEQAYAIKVTYHRIFEYCRIQGEFFNALFEGVQAELSNFAEITDSKNF